MGANGLTLDVYERNFNCYVDSTPASVSEDDPWAEWMRDLVDSYLSIPADGLEIGSAHGRDAKYLAHLGVNMTVSDATDAAVNYLRDNGFPEAIKLNALTDRIDGQYDLIFAAAVFLHFSEDELRQVLQKIHSNLRKKGVVAFSVQIGDGEEWRNNKMEGARYFMLWQSDDLRRLLHDEGYEVLDERELDSGKWLHYIMRSIDGD